MTVLTTNSKRTRHAAIQQTLYDWADAPLTEDEEAGLRQGRENVQKGEYLTLSEFRCGV